MKLLVYRKGSRRVPNGTPGGVRGRRETASYSIFMAQNGQKKSRRRSTLPRSHPRSTIDAKELNFRVRDGIGCGLFAVITGKIEEAIKSHVRWATSGRRINVSQAVLPDRFGLSLQRGGEVIKPNDRLVQVR